MIVTPLLIPVWATTLTVTLAIGPLVDAATELRAVVQKSTVAGQWVDVGGLSASGVGAGSSATTVHPCNARTSYRIASNFAYPSILTAVA